MRKTLLIVLLMAVTVSLRAQEKRTYYSSDTLNYQQLMKDYVSLNNQIIQFKKCELRSIGFGLGSGVLAFAGAAVYDHSEGGATALWVASGFDGRCFFGELHFWLYKTKTESTRGYTSGSSNKTPTEKKASEE